MSDDLGYRVSIEGRDEVLKQIQQAFQESDRLDRVLRSVNLDRIEQLQETLTIPDIIDQPLSDDKEPVEIGIDQPNLIPESREQKNIFNRRFIDQVVPIDIPITTDIKTFNALFPVIKETQNFETTDRDDAFENLKDIKKDISEYVKAFKDAQISIESSFRDSISARLDHINVNDLDGEPLTLENFIEEKEKLLRISNVVKTQETAISESSRKIATKLGHNSVTKNAFKTLNEISSRLSTLQLITEKIRTSSKAVIDQNDTLSEILVSRSDLTDINLNTEDTTQTLGLISETTDIGQIRTNIRQFSTTMSDMVGGLDSQVSGFDRQEFTKNIEEITRLLEEYITSSKTHKKVMERSMSTIRELQQNHFSNDTFVTDLIKEINTQPLETSSNQNSLNTTQFSESGTSVTDDTAEVNFPKIIYRGRVTSEGNIIRIDDIIRRTKSL